MSTASRIHHDKRPRLRSSAFAGFVASNFSAAIGRNGYYIVSAWVLVQAGSGNAGVATLLAIVSLVELAASPLAGSAADRFDRRRLNIAADLGRFGVMIATACMLLYLDVFPTLCLSAGLFSLCDRVALTASQAMVPRVTRGSDLAKSNSTVFLVMQFGGLAAALLAGPLLNGHPPALAYAVLALFFVASVGLLISMRVDWAPHDVSRAGVPAANADFPLCRVIVPYALLYASAVLVTVMGSSFVFDEQKGTAAQFGYLEAAWSAGSLVGAVLLVRLKRAISARRLHLMLLGATAFALMSLVALRLPWSLLVFATLGCLYNLGRVSIEVALQSQVADSVLGRTKGIMHSLAVALGLLVFSTVAVLGASVFPSTVFFGFGVVLLIVMLALSIGVPQQKGEA